MSYVKQAVADAEHALGDNMPTGEQMSAAANAALRRRSEILDAYDHLRGGDQVIGHGAMRDAMMRLCGVGRTGRPPSTRASSTSSSRG